MSTSTDSAVSTAMNVPLMIFMWLWVVVPFGYGIYQLVIKIPALFGV